MRFVLERLWKRTFSGNSPNLFVTSSGRILFQFGDSEASLPASPTKLVCLDRYGRELWRKPEWFVYDVLPGDRWLGGSTSREKLQVFEATGVSVADAPIRAEVIAAVRHPDRLALASEDQRIFVTDLSLAPVAEFDWPGLRKPELGCLIGQHFHWTEENDVWRVDFTGRAQKIAEIPLDTVEQSMTDYELESGRPAKEGWVISLPGSEGRTSDTRRFTIGDRPLWYLWSLRHVPESATLFLSNLTMPHILLCMDESFALRWCRQIHWGCCGGPGYPLHDGLWVTSSGCGGVLSWLDDAGNIVARSDPHPGSGLAIALSSRIQVIGGHQALVDGAPGLMAYERGKLVWRLDLEVLDSVVSEPEELLLVCGRDQSLLGAPRVFLEAYRLPGGQLGDSSETGSRERF